MINPSDKDKIKYGESYWKILTSKKPLKEKLEQCKLKFKFESSIIY